MPANKKSAEVTQNVEALNNLAMAINTATQTRESLLSSLLDGKKDINHECGYPRILSIREYKELYDREGVASRIVSLYPEESWTEDPHIFETEGSDETEFEIAYNELENELNINHYLSRIDELSGIGHFGILLLGFSDGGELHQPVPGIDEAGNEIAKAKGVELLYLRPFDESCVDIAEFEKNPKNPRYGLPVIYNVSMSAPAGTTSHEVNATSIKVHWSRVIHVAEHRKSSEVFAVPRLQQVFNRMSDLRKLLGGSAEMFWKGGFPGFELQIDPEATVDDALITKVKAQLEDYSNSLSRFFISSGMELKQLQTQIANPDKHVDVQLKMISIAIAVPLRVFLGSEQAQLASSQDKKTWNSRLVKRQNRYITPMILRPLIDRLIAVGALPEPVQYFVSWPDLNASSDADKAEVAGKWAEAFAKYSAGGVANLIPVREFMINFLNMDVELVDSILEAAEQQIIDTEDPEDEEDDPDMDPDAEDDTDPEDDDAEDE